MERVRRSRGTGLGDPESEEVPPPPMWRPAHIAVLEEIRDEIAALGRAHGEHRLAPP